MAALEFSVSLAGSDWDPGQQAWRCPVLAVPGSSVYDLYAGKRIHPDAYEALPNHKLIRWRGSEPVPERVIALVRLSKALAEEELTMRWKKLAIILPFVAVLTGVAAEHFRGGKDDPASPRFEKWTVSGRVDLSGSTVKWHDVGLTFQPPDLRLMEDGSFKADIPVEISGDGKHNFPSLVFRGAFGHDVPVVHLAGGSFGDRDYGVTRDEKHRDLKLKQSVRFSPHAGSGYDPKKTQTPTQTRP